MTTTATIDRTDLRIISARRGAILLKMQMLTDAPGAKAPDQAAHISKSSTTGGPPSGVNLSELDTRKGPPPKERSLYAHYVWHFAQAKGNATRTRALCDCAEADYGEYVGGRRHQMDESTEERSRRILRDYKGWSAERAAHMEQVGADAIRKLRQRSGYDAKTGEEREDFAEVQARTAPAHPSHVLSKRVASALRAEAA